MKANRGGHAITETDDIFECGGCQQIPSSGVCMQWFEKAKKTLGAVVAALEELTGVETRRIHVDKGIVATTTPTSSGSGSRGRSAGSPPPSGAR
jgi:hypothetical protein